MWRNCRRRPAKLYYWTKGRSEEHTSELQSQSNLVCRLLLEKKISINPLQGRTQLRLVEVAVVDDPAPDARVVHLGQFSQGLLAPVMHHPATALLSCAV